MINIPTRRRELRRRRRCRFTRWKRRRRVPEDGGGGGARIRCRWPGRKTYCATQRRRRGRARYTVVFRSVRTRDPINQGRGGWKRSVATTTTTKTAGGACNQIDSREFRISDTTRSSAGTGFANAPDYSRNYTRRMKTFNSSWIRAETSRYISITYISITSRYISYTRYGIVVRIRILRSFFGDSIVHRSKNASDDRTSGIVLRQSYGPSRNT